MTARDAEQKSTQRLRSGRRPWRWASLLVALVALGLGVAACGRGSPKASSDPTDSSGLPSSSKLFADALKYAGCMRSHGLTDFPDPTMGSSGMPNFSINASGNSDLDPQSSLYQAAQKVCKKDLPNLGEETPAEKAAANAKALKYSVCMRSHGEPDFPDPNGQGLISITNATGILDPSSPQYEKAQKACQSLDNGFEEQMSSSARSPGGSGHPSNAPPSSQRSS